MTLRRIWSAAIGFPGFHALNLVLAIGYALLQTLIFARVLPTAFFAQTVAANAIGLYLLPINQSVARANFVLLRETNVRGAAREGAPEASVAFFVSQLIMLAATLAGPLALGVHSPVKYATLALLLFYVTFSNVWVVEVQMMLLASSRALWFEYVNTLRRLLTFVLLGWLYFERDFLHFTLAAAALTLAFQVFLMIRLGRRGSLFAFPRGVQTQEMKAHLKRLWISLQATVSEWLGLNAPYALFTARFGIGPGLIAFDAVMKLIRVEVSATRNISEIALPRVSHAVFSGDSRRARLPVGGVLGLALAGASVLGIVVLLREHQVFSILLGPNNTVPAGAGGPAALAFVASAIFAAGAHLVGHTGDPRSIRLGMAAAIIAAVGLAAVDPAAAAERPWRPVGFRGEPHGPGARLSRTPRPAAARASAPDRVSARPSIFGTHPCS